MRLSIRIGLLVLILAGLAGAALTTDPAAADRINRYLHSLAQ